MKAVRQISFKFVCDGTGTTLSSRAIIPYSKLKIPAVIILTGDGRKGSKSFSWINFPSIFSENNIATYLFDFEGLGDSQGDRTTLTLSKGIENFKSAFDVLRSIEEIDQNRIGIFASSFGATVAILCPHIINQCQAIGLKSPACFLPDAYKNEIGIQNINRWFEEGYLSENGYDISVFLDSFKYNPYLSSLEIKTPCLITHGNSDEIVPIVQSYYLYNILNCPKELHIFENGNHNYSEGDAWDKMADIFTNWFKSHL